jgi:hypothetical protein
MLLGVIWTAGFMANVPARKCTSCGDLLISDPRLRTLERCHARLACDGRVGSEGFRWLRKAAGLKAVHLAEPLDVTSMRVSR